MGKWLTMLVLMTGCATYFGDDAEVGPDAAVVAEPDAASCPMGRVLPPCGDIEPGCATGTIEIDCPYADGHQADDEVCFCPGKAIGAPHGWCIAP